MPVKSNVRTPEMSWQETARGVLGFSRAHEWHPGKLPILLGIAGALALAQPRPDDARWLALGYMLTSVYLAIGYMLNNIADTREDKEAGKQVGLAGWSLRTKGLLVLVTAIVGLGLSAVCLPPSATSALAGCYVLAWIYSFPPRLKEHVVGGPLLAAFSQVPAPALAMWLAHTGGLAPVAGVYVLTAFCYGLRMILVHQIFDHDNDVRTRTRTTVTVLGVPTARRLLRGVFAVELAVVSLLMWQLAAVTVPALLIVGLAWPVALGALRLRRGEALRLDTYQWIPLATLHESVLPLVIVGTLALRRGGAFLAVAAAVAVLFAGRHFDRLVRPMLRWEDARD